MKLDRYNQIKLLVGFLSIVFILVCSWLLLTTSYGSLSQFTLSHNESSAQLEDVPVAFNSNPEAGYPNGIFILGSLDSNNVRYCSGIIWRPQLILTAAHCLDEVQSASITRVEPDGTMNTRNADKAFLPKEYLSGQSSAISDVRNDYALLKLTSPFSNLEDQPTSIAPLTAGCDYELVSFGHTNEDNYGPVQGNEADSKQSLPVCIDQSQLEDVIKVNTDQGAGICQGDSGGPIFKKDSNEFVTVISGSAGNRDGNCTIDGDHYGVRLERRSQFLSQIEQAVSWGDDNITNLDVNVIDFSNQSTNSCQGDYNDDKEINLADLAIFVSNYRKQNIDCSLDLSKGDCYLGLSDLAVFVDNYRKVCN